MLENLSILDLAMSAVNRLRGPNLPRWFSEKPCEVNNYLMKDPIIHKENK